MLGHARLDTTQVYTRVSIQKLKAIHDATHPGARLRPRAKASEAPPLALAAPSGQDTAEALAELAAEDEEEE
jgi:integrase/recombinase XerD